MTPVIPELVLLREEMPLSAQSLKILTETYIMNLPSYSLPYNNYGIFKLTATSSVPTSFPSSAHMSGLGPTQYPIRMHGFVTSSHNGSCIILLFCKRKRTTTVPCVLRKVF